MNGVILSGRLVGVEFFRNSAETGGLVVATRGAKRGRSSSKPVAAAERRGARSGSKSGKKSRARRSAPSRETRQTASPQRKRVKPTRTRANNTVAKRKAAARAAASRARASRPAPKPSRLAAAATLVRGAAAGVVAAIAQRLPWSTTENDPLVLLETDHRRFEDLLRKGVQTSQRGVKRRTQLLTTLVSELNTHELIEERILYPALKPHPAARDIVLEGYQEHHVADLIARELRTLAKDDEKWGAKFKVFKESIEHHIQEEESNMFRTARAVLSRDELLELGARMRALKTELEA